MSTRNRIRRASALLQDQIHGLASLAQTAIKSGGANEVTLEAHVKFGGGVNVIPFLAAATGEGGLKLTLTWKQESA